MKNPYIHGYEAYIHGFHSYIHEYKIPLFKSTHINNLDVVQTVSQADIDWLFIIGWSQFVNQNLLESPKKGVLGIHPTL